MENYIKGETLGEGTFGIVFKACHKETGQTVAIKKIRLGKAKEGVNVTALREIKLLRELDSPYIVRLLDVFPHKQNLNLVFEFMESDLEALIRDRSIIISPPDIKAYMRMGLQALDFCHSRWVLHRDVKPNNFLMSATGEMKLADFGLSRVFASPDPQYTNQVFSRWYRAPELLFGSTLYGPGVDIWGLGCVFAELLLRRPWLPGNSDIDQLSRIFQALGTPTTAQWPRMRDLPQFVEFQPSVAPPLRSTFRQASEDALDLLSRMVAYDPARRITAAEALKHRYFRSEPAATPPARLPRPPIKAHHPLATSTMGGSAIQQAPGEGISQEGQDANGAAAPDAVDGLPDAGHANGGSAPPSTGGHTTNGGGTPSRPQCKDEDLRYLRKRKLFSEDALQTPGTSAT